MSPEKIHTQTGCSKQCFIIVHLQTHKYACTHLINTVTQNTLTHKTYRIEVQVHLYQRGHTCNGILQVSLAVQRGIVPMNLLYEHATHVCETLCGDHNASNCHWLYKWCQHLHQGRVFPKMESKTPRRSTMIKAGLPTKGTMTYIHM